MFPFNNNFIYSAKSFYKVLIKCTSRELTKFYFAFNNYLNIYINYLYNATLNNKSSLKLDIFYFMYLFISLKFNL